MAARLGGHISGQKRFLGDTAHELRSPLGRMQVALGLLDTRVGETERPYLADLKEDVESLARLTDDLMIYAQTELGRPPQPTTPLAKVSVRPIAQKVATKESAPNVAIRVDIPEHTDVIADAPLFERALSNVVRNAVRYAGDAGPIVISAETTGDHVVTIVSDNGPGIAAESLDRVFEPFFREDQARNRRTGGVGLGLAIMRSAIEACGGSVTCRNREPRGLEVRMILRA
jgi:two-component system sensor histidine kinase CpxA